ncbi:family 2A encapsulin nanocompartment cargo protein cysteine desulfurase [Treponema primitia]|uniref:family 2A encapsulin nanocompartment cargo protein cysteine desulfurase n=1 Tax=Treponema primitia TaxID=88058 RepID=UPI001FDF77EB|nr:family 2A encapsulin nanocompartment cargo protein cysteine desulfurase [Treponema primitia]
MPGEYLSSGVPGLPSAAEIANWALAYFPEFAAPSGAADQAGGAAAADPYTGQLGQYAPTQASAPSAGQYVTPAVPYADQYVPTQAGVPSTGQYTPSVVPYAGQYAPTQAAGQYTPASAAPGALTETDLLRVLNESLEIGSILADPADNSGRTAAAVSDTSAFTGVEKPAASTAYSPRVLPEDRPLPAPSPAAAASPAVSPEPGRSLYVGTRNVGEIRKDFPILAEKINGRDLVWLDNAATTQKPRQVIDRLTQFYEHENSNVHRGAHELAARSTDAYEGARGKVARFIGAASADNIVFVRGTTEGINLAAQAYVKQLLRPGDEIILTILEHHANIVPWQLIAEETGAVIRVAPIDKVGQIILSEYSRLFNHRTKFVAATQVSNALGTIAPVEEMIHIAHAQGVRILIDGAQSVSHMPVNVTALDADFFVFSGHKIFAPTGIGVLYGKTEVLEAAKPYQGGGNMIADVTFERTLYQKPPNKFEAGTGNIADAVGLGAALDYVSAIGIANIGAYEHELVQYGMAELAKVPGLRLIGTAPQKASVLSFVLEGYDNEEVGKYLNTQGIAVRAGHHCAQPVLRNFGLEGTVRPSVAFYNTPGEIDALVQALYTLVHRH